MNKKIIALISFAILILGSCTSAPTESESVAGEYTFSHAYDENKFINVIESNTQSTSKFDGFTNTFQFKATIQNSAVTEAILWRKSEDYKWTREKLQEERKKDEAELSSQTRVFLSFFTPINDSDNLATGRSVWKVYLESNGKRYEAKVEKVSSPLSELQSWYSYHTRFSTPYMLVFATSTVQVQQAAAKLIITGPVGNAEVEFDGLSQPQ